MDTDLKSLSTVVDKMAHDTQLALQRQYDVIERQGSRVDAAISSLQTTMAGNGKANWPVIISACSFVLAISATVGTLALSPHREALLGVQAQARTLTDRVAAAESFQASQVVENRAARELSAVQQQRLDERIDHVRELMGVKGPATPTPP